jgi:hypothetical protein
MNHPQSCDSLIGFSRNVCSIERVTKLRSWSLQHILGKGSNVLIDYIIWARVPTNDYDVYEVFELIKASDISEMTHRLSAFRF